MMNMPVHEWQADLGPYTGKAGEKKVLSIVPQVFYRVENIFATDDSSSVGNGTRIGHLIVGNKVQRPVDSSTLTAIFGADAFRLGRPRSSGGAADEGGLRWDMCPPGSTISVEVIFVQACTFNMTFFGEAIG